MYKDTVIDLSMKARYIVFVAKYVMLASICMLASVHARADLSLTLKQAWYRGYPVYNDISAGIIQTNPLYTYRWSTNQSWPVLLSRGNTVTVVATLGVAGAPGPAFVRVVSSPNIGVTFPDTEIVPTQNGDGDLSFYSGASIVTNAVQKLGLILTFYSRPNTNTGWSQFGTCVNPTYITLSNPIDPRKAYRTVLEQACGTGGATNNDQAFANTWSRFTNRSVQTWYGSTLYYYQPGTSFTNNGASVENLLTARTGQCGSWRELLFVANGMNGISSVTPVKVVVSATHYTLDKEFAIKNWSTNNAGGNTNSATYKWRLYPPVPVIGEMNPPPLGNNYGDLTSLSGLPGQGTPSATPSEKQFTAHFIVKYGTNYYDPSYGVTYTDRDNMAASVFVFGANGDSDGLGILFLPTRVNPYPYRDLLILENQ